MIYGNNEADCNQHCQFSSAGKSNDNGLVIKGGQTDRQADRRTYGQTKGTQLYDNRWDIHKYILRAEPYLKKNCGLSYLKKNITEFLVNH